MELSERIRQLRRAQDMTVEELGHRVGVGKSTISKWESGKISNMRRDSLLRLAEALHVSTSQLLNGESAEETDAENPARDIRRVPVYGKVAAGIPIEAITDIDSYEDIDMQNMPAGNYIALRVGGDSMEPRLLRGDVIIVRLQEEADTGDIVVVMINGCDATCKKLEILPEGIRLISLNPNYSPMTFSNEQVTDLPVRLLGRVIEVRSRL